MRQLFAILGLTGLLLVPPVARATSPSTCGREWIDLCARDGQTASEFVACARNKQSQLSLACRDTLEAARRPFERRANRPRARLRQVCGADVRRLCANVERRMASLAACLDRQRRDISPACLVSAASLIERYRPPPSNAPQRLNP